MQLDENKYLTPGTIYPPAPKTKRGDFSFLDIANDHFLYFNGPTLIVRPLNSSQLLKYFVHKSDVTAAKFSNNGKFIASIDQKGTLIIHELGEKQLFESKKYQNFYSTARAIEWSADQKRICVIGSGKNSFGRVALIQSGTNVGQISGVSANLTCCSFRPQRPYNLVVGGDEFVIKFYQGPPYKFVKSSAKIHSNYINGIKYSPLGTYVISISSDKKMILHDGLTFDLIRQKVNTHERSILGVDWIDEKTFITVSADKVIKIWNADFQQLNTIKTCNQQQQKDNKNFQQFQVAVKYYNGKIYSLSLNGQILQFPRPSLEQKVVEFNPQKIKKYAGWLNKPIAVLNGSKQKDKQVFIVDSNGRILQISQTSPNNLSDQVQLLSQNYQSSMSIISSIYNYQNQSISLVLANGTLSEIQLDLNHKLNQKIRVENSKFKLVTSSISKDPSLIALSNKIVGFSKNAVKSSPQIGQDVTSIKAFQNYIFIGTLKGNIHIFNAQTFQFVTKTNLSATKLSFIYVQKSVKQSEYILICGDALGKLFIYSYNLATKQFVELPNTLGNHESLITGIYGYKLEYLFTFGMDNKINLWQRVEQGKYSRLSDWRNSHQFGILSGQIVGNSLFTVGGDYLVKQWLINI